MVRLGETSAGECMQLQQENRGLCESCAIKCDLHFHGCSDKEKSLGEENQTLSLKQEQAQV